MLKYEQGQYRKIDSLNMCFWCSKEPYHGEGSFEYLQHMFWLRNKKNNFLLHTLIWGPDYVEFGLNIHLFPYFMCVGRNYFCFMV